MQWMTRVSIRVYLPWSRRKKKRKVREDRCVQKRIVRTLSASICGMLIIVVGVVIALQLNNTDIDLDTSSISTMKSSSKSSEIHPASPSEQPSVIQSILMPSLRPTYGPTVMIRTPGPSVDVSKSNYSDSETLLTFCVIADVPYVEEEALALPKQIQNETEGCEFLVHLGDIMPGD